MAEYVIPENIDDRILSLSVRNLAAGELVAIPTDTTWGVVCSLQSKEGIRRLRRLSGEREERLFTLLCSDISQFQEFCSMDNTRYRLIKRLSPGPYTFILKTLPNTEKALNLRRSELGVRIPNHLVPLALIRTMGIPLYSITAKRSMLLDESSREELLDTRDSPDQLFIPEDEFFQSGRELADIKSIKYVLDTDEDLPRTFSTILDLSGDEVRLVRQGAGPWPA